MRRRNRTIRIWRARLILKQSAWRLTGFWLWARLLIHLFGGGTFLRKFDAGLFSRILEILKDLGFAPGHVPLLPFLLRLLWVLCITSFSWLQIIGLTLYVFFWPLVLFFYFRHGSAFKATYDKEMEKAQRLRTRPNRAVGTYFLISCLIVWFVLYGDSSLRAPLIVAIVLIGTLFIVRVYQALAYTAPYVSSRMGPIDRYIESVLAQFRKGITDLAEKRTVDLNSISASVRTWNIYYRVLRFLSRWLYGRSARNRAALFVLIRYMLNLCLLGALAILFWALVIRYYSLPDITGMVPALLASSARVIPGIPEPNSLKFPDWIKVSTSITAWMIFVLYAGPVASLFPVLQDRFVKQTSNLYGRLRIARKTLYGPLYPLHKLFQFMRDNPEAAPYVNCIFFFKMQPDLSRLFRDEPDAARMLRERPDLIEILAGAGIKIPNLDEFVPTKTVDDGIDPQKAISALSEDSRDLTSESGNESSPAAELPNLADEPSAVIDSPPT